MIKEIIIIGTMFFALYFWVKYYKKMDSDFHSLNSKKENISENDIIKLKKILGVCSKK